MTTETIKRSPGRPVNPNSPRQIALREKVERGPGQKGRPVNPESKRQQYLATKGENPNGKGRPVNPESARQQKINRITEMKANGTYKLGRPKMVKTEEVTVELQVVETPEIEIEETVALVGEVVSPKRKKK